MASHWDLLQTAMNITQKHNLFLEVHHIKSHQDQERAYEKLDWQLKFTVAQSVARL